MEGGFYSPLAILGDMPAPLVPATLALAPDGTPYSTLFEDVYHSTEGGPAQARHVFLGGNGLPDRWQGRERFTILETGFGLGLNFLATWSAWKADPRRPAKLHFVSVEKHPFAAADLAAVHARHPEFEALSHELLSHWPLLVPGMHRLELEQGRVVLTLYFADIEVALPQLRVAADALYLDGFSPAKNPAMWAPPLFKSLAKLAAEGATVATYTVASAVREALASAGFAVEKRAGFAKKRDMLCGRYARHGVVAATPSRRALVIGAGLAGSAACERLASRGWEVLLLERRDSPAQEASGNHAGAFHPIVTRDDSLLARLTRAAFLYSLRHWKTLEGVEWSRCGVLQMPRTGEEAHAQAIALETLGFPPGYVRHVSREEASRLAGTEVAEGGLWFPESGWMQPQTLARALINKSGVERRFGVEVHSLERGARGWVALDDSRHVLAEAPVVILANALEAAVLCPMEHLDLRRVRGQVSYLPAERFPTIGAVLLRGGMVVPPVGGIAVAGASFDIDDPDAVPRIDSHAGNLDRLERILPGAGRAFSPEALEGRVGFRAVARDRLPVVGPLPGHEGVLGAFAYGSRGILWCSLMAELVASQLESEPWPMEAQLAAAVGPARFQRRAAR